MCEDEINFSSAIVTEPIEEPLIVKEGPIKIWENRKLRKSQWKDCHAILYSDSTFEWYGKKGDAIPIKSILLKNMIKFICVGELARAIPTIIPPEVPLQCSDLHRIAIGEASSEPHWFLFDSDTHIDEWFKEFIKTLPNPDAAKGDGSGGIALKEKNEKCTKQCEFSGVTFATVTVGEIVLKYGFGIYFYGLKKGATIWLKVGTSGKRWRTWDQG